MWFLFYFGEWKMFVCENCFVVDVCVLYGINVNVLFFCFLICFGLYIGWFVLKVFVVSCVLVLFGGVVLVYVFYVDNGDDEIIVIFVMV